MIKRNILAVELAAGLGTRMKAKDHKPLVEANSQPLASYFIKTIESLGLDLLVVVNPQFEKQVKTILDAENKYHFVVQPTPNGNAGALIVALGVIREMEPAHILVAQSDDSALYSPDLLEQMISKHQQNNTTITLLTLASNQVPQYFWQVGLDKNSQVIRVFEGNKGLEKENEKRQALAGCFLFQGSWLLDQFDPKKLLPHGKQKELILPDIVDQALEQNLKVQAIEIKVGQDWWGVNTPRELVQLEQILQSRQYG
jgi:bifunctional UDP-N-acetylglucosamine pyrophosphorylase/glucosamine-1-phosphate N-acetyltransferase